MPSPLFLTSSIFSHRKQARFGRRLAIHIAAEYFWIAQHQVYIHIAQMFLQWLLKNNISQNALNPLEKLCYIGKRGMEALEYEPAFE
ncbi:MAG: hypothetical protein FWC26_13725 [Fibromonadales bacterium]|nr:hypothetical protein [Fibromonadales bacterium]